ncbi:MAG: hypothetical protein ACRDD7_05735 [Peptostreptococcaceae bacterium]
MVNNGGNKKKTKLMNDIRELMKLGEFKKARVELFKFNNSYNKSVLDRYFGLYNLAYCYDSLNNKEMAKYHISQADVVLQLYSEKYPIQYSMVANLMLYLMRNEMKEEKQLEIYKRLYNNNKHEGDTEFNLSTLSSIYKIEKSFELLIEVFNKCLDYNYITTCESIIETNKKNLELVAEMQLLIDRKQKKVS